MATNRPFRNSLTLPTPSQRPLRPQRTLRYLLPLFAFCYLIAAICSPSYRLLITFPHLVTFHYAISPIPFPLPSIQYECALTIPTPGAAMPRINPIRVLVADDSPTALRSVCDYLDFAGGMEVICTASDGVNAVQLVAQHQPDLALLDFRMPRLNGLQAAQALRRSHPTLPFCNRHPIANSRAKFAFVAATFRSPSCSGHLLRCVVCRFYGAGAFSSGGRGFSPGVTNRKQLGFSP